MLRWRWGVSVFGVSGTTLLGLCGEVSLGSLSRQGVAGAAAGAVGSDCLVALEKLVDVGSDEGLDHAHQFFGGAPAAPAVAALFQRAEFLEFVEAADVVEGGLVKPRVIPVRVGAEDGELGLTELEKTGRTLFAALVELFHREEGVAAGKMDVAANRVAVARHEVLVKALVGRLFDVLDEKTARDGALAGVADEEEVQQGGLEVDRPADVLVARARGAVQDKGREGAAQALHRLRRALVVMVRHVFFPGGENGTQVRPCEQAVAVAYKQALHCGASGRRNRIGRVVHAVTLQIRRPTRKGRVPLSGRIRQVAHRRAHGADRNGLPGHAFAAALILNSAV